VGLDNNNENKETLHIKKHSTGGEELHYYSSRKERLSLPSASKLYMKTPKKKRRVTSSVIIILDIVIIVIAFILFRIFLFEAANQATMGGYQFTLRQIVSVDTVVASITVKNVSQSGQNPETQAQAVFSLLPGNSVRNVLFRLPKQQGGASIVRVSFPLTKEDKIIQAKIILGGDSKELSLSIKKKSN
jgi:hypothetical protein